MSDPRDPHTYIPARERTGAFGRFQMRPSHLRTQISADQVAATQATAHTVITPEEEHAAALTVCEITGSASAARPVLAALGLYGLDLAPTGTGLLACGHPAAEGIRSPIDRGVRCRRCSRERRGRS